MKNQEEKQLRLLGFFAKRLRTTGFVQHLVKVPGILSRKILLFPLVIEMAGQGWPPSITASVSRNNAK